MLSWAAENATLLQLGVAIVSAIVWLVYLQLFLVGFMRQRRSEILISRGAGVGMEARCYIANLGFEPIYLSQVLISIRTAEGNFDAAITDREAMTEEQLRDPKQATNQGPLKSGDSFDAGSFGELVGRAFRGRGCRDHPTVESFDLTVVALHASSSAFVGAVRHFDVIQRDGQSNIVPDDLTTRQIRSPLSRWRLKARLQRDLSWYRS
jgi:hypothetical protein